MYKEIHNTNNFNNSKKKKIIKSKKEIKMNRVQIAALFIIFIMVFSAVASFIVLVM